MAKRQHQGFLPGGKEHERNGLQSPHCLDAYEPCAMCLAVDESRHCGLRLTRLTCLPPFPPPQHHPHPCPNLPSLSTQHMCVWGSWEVRNCAGTLWRHRGGTDLASQEDPHGDISALPRDAVYRIWNRSRQHTWLRPASPRFSRKEAQPHDAHLLLLAVGGGGVEGGGERLGDTSSVNNLDESLDCFRAFEQN